MALPSIVPPVPSACFSAVASACTSPAQCSQRVINLFHLLFSTKSGTSPALVACTKYMGGSPSASALLLDRLRTASRARDTDSCSRAAPFGAIRSRSLELVSQT